MVDTQLQFTCLLLPCVDTFSASQCVFVDKPRSLLLFIAHKALQYLFARSTSRNKIPPPTLRHYTSLTASCSSTTLRYFPSRDPSCSCPFQEVKMKGQTFFSVQTTDFLRLVVSSVATKAFPEQSHYCSSTGMGNTQSMEVSRIISLHREQGTLMPTLITSNCC